MPVFALTLHADYRCRHAGACCTSDWDVPVEVPLHRTLQDAIDHARVSTAAVSHDGGPALVIDDDLDEGVGAMVARTSAGDCVFYHRSSGLCVVHRDLGEPSLPSTCRHFPRLAVRDRRGTFITLTHYCPTAAEALFRTDVDLAIVEAPEAFPDRDYDGLTVSDDEWPPLLQPRKLLGFEGYHAWERHMVSRCADARLSPEQVVATLERDARYLRATVVADPSELTLAVAGLPAEAVHVESPTTLAASLALVDGVRRAIPDEWRPAEDEAGLEDAFERFVRPAWPAWHRVVRHFIAAKAFASWTAYQGHGLLTIVRGLEAALALLRVEASRACRNAGRSLDRDTLHQAIRHADFVLNHLAGGDELARAWTTAEDTR